MAISGSLHIAIPKKLQIPILQLLILQGEKLQLLLQSACNYYCNKYIWAHPWPTIPGAVEACGLGDCSRDPLFQVSCKIAISQPGVAGPPTAPSGSGERVRVPPWLPVSDGHY